MDMHSAHLMPSTMNTQFHFEGTTYTDYIQCMQTLIGKARVDLTHLSPTEIAHRIHANAPSEYRPTIPTRHGILLIHGLSSSPMAMSSLMHYFSRCNKYLIRSLLLPGHGTRPGDLLNATYQDWLDACQFGIESLRKEVDHVTVIGFSAGTALAAYLSLTETNIDSLVMLAPAISLKNPFIKLTPLLYLLRNQSLRLNWPILKKETDYAKYQSMPMNAIYQITSLINAMHRINHLITIPIYMASTVDDETIRHEKAIQFFLQQPNPLNRGIIYGNHPHATVQPLPTSLTYRQSSYPEHNILNFSHVSLAIAPDHPHYGKQGDFSNFMHPRTHKKNKHKPLHHGAISKKNLQHHCVQRLTYNPDFAYLASDIEAFLEDCANIPNEET